MQGTFQHILVFVFLLVVGTVSAQRSKPFVLPAGLTEISGLELINDTTLVAINDGGNSAQLYVLEKNGKLRKKVKVQGAENIDWEDLACDGTFLYIGDIGNNNNKRKDLCVYKVLVEDVLKLEMVEADKISFRYKEQTSFPPSADKLNYDAEGLVCYEESLWIFTKTNSEPWTGNSLVYKLPKASGKDYIIAKQNEVFIGDSGWWADAITGVDVIEDNFYFLSYNRVSIMKFAEKEFKLTKTIKFEGLTQKESIVVLNSETFFVADEKQVLLGGGNLYKMEIKND